MDVATKDVGYTEPGHGAKGRQMWLETEDDLHENVPDILLWCYMKAEWEDDRPIRARKRHRQTLSQCRSHDQSVLHLLKSCKKLKVLLKRKTCC